MIERSRLGLAAELIRPGLCAHLACDDPAWGDIATAKMAIGILSYWLSGGNALTVGENNLYWG